MLATKIRVILTFPVHLSFILYMPMWLLERFRGNTFSALKIDGSKLDGDYFVLGNMILILIKAH